MVGEDDGSIEAWNKVLDSDVEEMRVLKVISHVLGYRVVAESLRAEDGVRLLGKEMGLCGVEMGLDGEGKGKGESVVNGDGIGRD
ncbi:hypothetical protein V6N13_047966 [Hibiscus sabdariffa]|uniref:Uncharacterized protein n=1 Tax=Hibiscus sabdariffa TaxID=183260 RepID=A0ABR2F5U3_9ROSI